MAETRMLKKKLCSDVCSMLPSPNVFQQRSGCVRKTVAAGRAGGELY